MTAAQVIAIVCSAIGGIAMLIAMVKPNFERFLSDWRLRTGTGIVGFLILLAGIGGAFHFAHKPKTLVESGREALDKGAHMARDGARRVQESLPQAPRWWPWGEKPTEKQ